MRVVPTPTSPVLINPNLLGHRNNCKQCSIKTLKVKVIPVPMTTGSAIGTITLTDSWNIEQQTFIINLGVC